VGGRQSADPGFFSAIFLPIGRPGTSTAEVQRRRYHVEEKSLTEAILMKITPSTGKELAGKKVAILVADGFEEQEMTEPKKALENAGASTAIVSPEIGTVQGWQHDKKGHSFRVDVPLAQAKPARI
jgi:hypothetical protein